MRRRTFLAAALTTGAALALPHGAAAQDANPTAVYGSGPARVSLATGSPGELGLLKTLAEGFSARENATVVWYRAGSGAALKLLKEGKVDMVVGHAPPAEKAAVAEGWAAARTLVGSNAFYLVGPAADPAGIRQAKGAADALRRISETKAKFVTRGDNSGTHQKETELWKAAGLTPAGDWYIPTRDFMQASLRRAEAEGAYFLTDSSTWIVERKALPGLTLLVKDDPALLNPYHTLLAPGSERRATAAAFARYLASEEGQAVIRGFGRTEHGEPLYKDAAATAPLVN